MNNHEVEIYIHKLKLNILLLKMTTKLACTLEQSLRHAGIHGFCVPVQPGVHLYFSLLDVAVVSVDVRTFYAKCFTTEIKRVQLPHLLEFKLLGDRATLTSVNSNCA